MEKTIKEDKSIQIIEKKSKFIATICYVKNKEEAEEKLLDIRKKYRDANHHCFAYRIRNENKIIERASDDGEPKGTAGGPILNTMNKQELINVLVIVTRYFGGVLLGTGGLVKAYLEATTEVIKQTEFVIEKPGLEWKIVIDYKQLEYLEYYCKENDITIMEIQYKEKVECIIEVTEEEKETIIKQKEELKFQIEESKIVKHKNIKKP